MMSNRTNYILAWFIVISGWTWVIGSNAQATNEILLYDFNDPAAYPGWTTYGYHKLQPSFADGALVGTVTDSDESGGVYFVTPPIQPFDASQYPYMQVRVKSNKNYQFEFYWMDDIDQTWVGHQALIPLVADGQYHTYQANLLQTGRWHNNITQLRFGITTYGTQPLVTPQVDDNISWDFLKLKMPTIPNNTMEFLNLWEREQVAGRLYHSSIALDSIYRMRLLTSGGSEVRSVTGAVTTVGKAEALLSTAGVTPGNYTLEFKAFAADNTTQQATASKPFPKLTTPVWLKTPVERQVNEVPAPWTPMTTATGQIQCWGRSYSFQSLPFPSQINSQGVNMLAAPIVLQGTIDNQSIGWNSGTFAFTDIQDYKVSYQTSCTGNVADLSGSGYVEFDGMMWFDFQLNLHSANAQISSLYLDIPLNKANALYYWYGGTSWDSYSADLFTSKSFPFMPYITVSDDERGLCWFTESKENWSIDSSSAAQLIAGTSINTVRVHLVNVPVTSDNQTVKFSFGLQATPVKPYPAQPEDHPGRYCVTDEMSGNGVYSFDKDIMSAYRAKSIAASNTGDRVMDLMPSDSGDKLALQNALADCENHGIKDLSYTNLENVNIQDEGLLQYGDEWMVMLNGNWQARPVQSVDNGFPDFYPVSTASGAWQDYLVWKVHQAIDQVGLQGVYLDCSDPGNCWNPYLGGGYTDRNGIVRPTLTIRANRELMKRLYALKKTHPNFRIEFHMSTFPVMSSHSLADIAMDGEQFVVKPSGFQLPLSSFRAEFMGKVWGIPSNLWVFTRNAGAPGYFDNERAVAFCILHGTEVNLEPSLLFLDRLGRLYDVMSLFQVSQAEAFPYWKNPPVTVSSTDVAANVYKKPGEALIILSNLRENALTVQVQPDLGQLGLSGDIYAKDYLDNATYHVTNGTFSTYLNTDIRVKIFHLGTIDKLTYSIAPQPTVAEFLGDNTSVSNFPTEWQACSALKNFVATEQPYTPAAFSNLWFDLASLNPSQRIFLGIEIRETGNGNPEGDGSASILRFTLNGQNLVYSETPGHGNLVGKTQPFSLNCGVGPNTWFGASQAWTVFYYPSFTLPTERRYQLYRPIGSNPLTYVFDITDLAIIGRNYLTLTTANSSYDSGLSIKTLAVGLTPPVTVSGTVTPNDYTGDKTAVSVQFEFRPVPTGSSTVLNTFLNADGTFTLDNVTLGTYNIAVKADHCLQKVLSTVDITANPFPLGVISVVNGDCDNDNEITSSDLSIVLSAMDTLPGNPDADLDGNGEVTSADLSIVLTGMDQIGDP
ncbi:MAG: glycoside hydrolase domain-containing protein [Phycisphaerae bacterium]